ncbi:MAG: hypothetical protein HUJ92_00460, partial [Bacteroidales bacterium]|nr:hypothetical protein [Bacteroidales bacterium]
CTAIAANAQPRAIGLRGCYGLEATYEHNLTNATMLQVELGTQRFQGLTVRVMHDWVWNINSSSSGNLNWYAGVGVTGGTPAFSAKTGFLGIAGRAALEYRFNIPLELSLDFTPTIGLALGSKAAAFYHDLYTAAIGLSIRYCF